MSDWSLLEVDLIIADYFSMLSAELLNQSYNKTEHRNNLLPLLNRNKGSIEFKHQNISAVLIKLGLPYINGYKPRWLYQKLLEERVIDYIGSHRSTLEIGFQQFVTSPTTPPVILPTFDKILENAPEKPEPKLFTEPSLDYKKRPIKINYLEREQSNSSLGFQGEQFVLAFEKWSLMQDGKENLADQVQWVAEHDDGAGFDILSKETNGKDKYIEVKTTKLGKETPIFFSKGEYEFSKRNADNYHLYRLFQFSKDPKLFIVNGDFDLFCQKETIKYKGYFS